MISNSKNLIACSSQTQTSPSIPLLAVKTPDIGLTSTDTTKSQQRLDAADLLAMKSRYSEQLPSPNQGNEGTKSNTESGLFALRVKLTDKHLKSSLISKPSTAASH